MDSQHKLSIVFRWLDIMMGFKKYAEIQESSRVSEPACFGAAPAPEIFYPEPAPAPGKREQNVGTF